MKKSIIICLFIIGLNFKLQAQITILQEDFAPNGSYLISAVDTQNLGNISPGSAGANQFWNFSTLSNTTTDTVKILNPGQTPFGSNFPQSNTSVQQFGGFYYYLKTTSSGLDVVGTGGSVTTPITNITASAPVNPPYTYLIFPSSYQTQYTDQSTVIFKVFINQTIPIPNIGNVKVDSARWTRKTNKEVIFDAWGETQTPLGKFKSIREKNKEKNDEKIEIQTLNPFTGKKEYIPIYDTVYTNIFYNYWAKEIGYALVQLTSDTNGKLTQASYLFAKPKAIAGPVANFSADTTVIYTNDTIYFKDLSLGDSLNWLWNFGDSSSTSSLQNPSHIYTKTGLFTVRLIVSNKNGLDTVIRTDYISVAMPPVKADFIYSLDGLYVNFSDKSLNINPGNTTWKWDFGDNKISSDRETIHKYTQPGAYKVKLVVKTTNSSDSVSKDITVISSIEEAISTRNFIVYPNPTTNEILIENLSEKVETFNFNIYNTQGKEMLQFSQLNLFPNQNKIISLNGFSKGLYFYTLKSTHQKNLVRGKIIKL